MFLAATMFNPLAVMAGIFTCFFGGTPKVSKPPSKSDSEVQQAAAEEARRARQAKGRQSTIFSDLYSGMKNTFGG
jgi:hypothetical protein